jgi:hypothetical protein
MRRAVCSPYWPFVDITVISESSNNIMDNQAKDEDIFYSDEEFSDSEELYQVRHAASRIRGNGPGWLKGNIF